MKQMTVVIIATNKYSQYAVNLIRSLWQYHEKDELDIHLFGDNCLRNAELTYQGVSYHTVEHQLWPFSTLNRFKFILSKKDQFKGSTFIYIDADTLVKKNLRIIEKFSDVTFVAHPGYWRPKKISILPFRKTKTLGTWEDRPEQLSFVHPSKRRIYVCGGVWFGPTASIIEMCEVLENLHVKDLGLNQIPIWHDESYLNWYLVEKGKKYVTPEFAFVKEYQHLKKLKPYIEVLEKPTNWKRD
jgi:hypothetical protein